MKAALTRETEPGRRADYRWFHEITTRWMDNDVSKHVNNVNYFSYFDTAVTCFVISRGVADLIDGPVLCMVAEVACRYRKPVAFPDRLTIGLRAGRIGERSVRYELGVFRDDEDEASAEGYFVHVFVDRQTQRPVAISPAARDILQQIGSG